MSEVKPTELERAIEVAGKSSVVRRIDQWNICLLLLIARKRTNALSLQCVTHDDHRSLFSS